MIYVIDAIMGTGKTTQAIDFMNQQPKKSFMYITPFLSEDQRIIEGTNGSFVMPKNSGDGKLANLKELLGKGENIASTHQLFKCLDEECKGTILFSEYTLILDECLDVIDRVSVKPSDLKLLIDKGLIEVGSDNYVKWVAGQDYDGVFEEIKTLANSHQLLCIDEKFFIWQYDPEVFKIFKDVYILTYMFKASIMSYYFDLWGIKYEVKSIRSEGGETKLVDYYKPDLTTIKNLIHIYAGNLNTNFQQKDTGLSKSWLHYSKNDEGIKQLKRNMKNIFTNVYKTTSEDFMWSTAKGSATKLSSKGFGYVDTVKYPKKENKTFVAFNARGTNQYAHKHYLAYAFNVYLPPEIKKYFDNQSNHTISVSEDLFALSTLIQWIWRSAIRNGEEIFIYLPSSRMRSLLINWLEGRYE